MTNSTHVVWFKRDLRISDHLPLFEAARSGQLLPLYIVEPELWKQPDSGRRHWHFIYDALQELQISLDMIGASLIIRIGEAVEVFQQLSKDVGQFTLWSHEESGNAWTYQRDMTVADWCRASHITWYEFPSNGVVRRLKSRDGWAKQRDEHMVSPIIQIPQQVHMKKGIQSQELPHQHHPMFGMETIGSVQTGGSKEAQKTLNSFLKERGCNYMQTLSKPGVSARHCSRLSPHLSYGTLSVREIEQATKSKIHSLAGNPDPNAHYFQRNLSAFLSRLAWHCHFIQKLEQQPNIETVCMHPAFEGMREPYFRDDYFEAWKTGNTGYPLVDACMRSLHANGWITFRMRAMLVSFASYHLWLDWRKTAPYLAQLFTDYEPGIHYSQFQMQSGVTGINALRIYNPIKQSYDHDPQGKFIRRYLPELHSVPDRFIHEPWLMDQPPSQYPAPIVEHLEAIRFARQEISARWKQDGFQEQSQEVRQKLGSRNKSLSKKKSLKKKDSQQLSFDL
jgi:deoxyribodipyrimidine photo-lyase